MTLHLVQVEERRLWTLYIDAEDYDEAEDAALELTAGLNSDDVEVEAEAYRVEAGDTTIKDSEDVWVGGEEGQFITYANYKRRQNRR